MKVRYSYLKQQFSNCDDLWIKLKEFVETGDFTLGKPLEKFEKDFAKLIGTKYCISVKLKTLSLYNNKNGIFKFLQAKLSSISSLNSRLNPINALKLYFFFNTFKKTTKNFLYSSLLFLLSFE